jgi:hypothetical protein
LKPKCEENAATVRDIEVSSGRSYSNFSLKVIDVNQTHNSINIIYNSKKVARFINKKRQKKGWKKERNQMK